MVSKQKIKNFQHQLKEISDKEFELRADMIHLYKQFVLDVKEEKTALRYIRQAYFNVLKNHLQQSLEDELEFHPFFGNDQERAEDEDEII